MTENEIQLIHILIQRIERLEQGFKKLQNDITGTDLDKTKEA